MHPRLIGDRRRAGAGTITVTEILFRFSAVVRAHVEELATLEAG